MINVSFRFLPPSSDPRTSLPLLPEVIETKTTVNRDSERCLDDDQNGLV